MKRVIVLCMGVVAVAGTPEWSRVDSVNFHLLTTAPAREARPTLERFEQVRDFFMRVNSSRVTTRLPVTIVGFRNRNEYKPYSANEVSAAYYTGDEQQDYIVMSGLTSENAPVAIHEYMHLLVRHSGLKMPLWLNEGFADVYSTLKPTGGQILLGSAPEGRGYALSQGKWLSLPALAAVRVGSPEYNEKDRAGVFYAESWLLTHMLMLGTDYKDKFSEFVSKVSQTGSMETALTAVYGKSIPEVTKHLSAYFHSNSLRAFCSRRASRRSTSVRRVRQANSRWS